MSQTKIDYDKISPQLAEEIQRLLPVLSAGGPITVTSELANIIAKFLRVASENGVAAFRPVDPAIAAEQALAVLDSELFS